MMASTLLVITLGLCTILLFRVLKLYLLPRKGTCSHLIRDVTTFLSKYNNCIDKQENRFIIVLRAFFTERAQLTVHLMDHSRSAFLRVVAFTQLLATVRICLEMK